MAARTGNGVRSRLEKIESAAGGRGSRRRFRRLGRDAGQRLDQGEHGARPEDRPRGQGDCRNLGDQAAADDAAGRHRRGGVLAGWLGWVTGSCLRGGVHRHGIRTRRWGSVPERGGDRSHLRRSGERRMRNDGKTHRQKQEQRMQALPVSAPPIRRRYASAMRHCTLIFPPGSCHDRGRLKCIPGSTPCRRH